MCGLGLALVVHVLGGVMGRQVQVLFSILIIYLHVGVESYAKLIET